MYRLIVVYVANLLSISVLMYESRVKKVKLLMLTTPIEKWVYISKVLVQIKLNCLLIQLGCCSNLCICETFSFCYYLTVDKGNRNFIQCSLP